MRPMDPAAASYSLALTLAQQGHNDQAEIHYRRTLELDPRHTAAWNNLGALLWRKNVKEAICCYQEAARLDPTFREPHKNLAELLAYAGDYEQAAFHAGQAVAMRPTSDCCLCLGICLYHLGHISQAIAAFDETVRLDPNNASAHAYLGVLMLLRGQFHEGFREMEWRWRCPDFVKENLQGLIGLATSFRRHTYHADFHRSPIHFTS